MKKKIFLILLLCMLVIMQHGISASAKTDTDYGSISIQLEKDVEKYHIPGMAVIVVDKDNVLFSETYGNCDSIDRLLS